MASDELEFDSIRVRRYLYMGNATRIWFRRYRDASLSIPERGRRNMDSGIDTLMSDFSIGISIAQLTRRLILALAATNAPK